MYIYCFGLEIYNPFSIMYIRILYSLFGYISNNTIYVEFAPFYKNMIKFVNPDPFPNFECEQENGYRYFSIKCFFLYISFSILYDSTVEPSYCN